MSLSEHVPFAIGLPGGEPRPAPSLLDLLRLVRPARQRAPAARSAPAVAALYGALYLLLQLEQRALLLGSMLLFAVLAALMVATRRIDWYGLLARMRAPGGAPVTDTATPQ